jgi:predicted dehydrogenase
MKRFRVVVAGCGAMSDAWVDAALKISDVEVVGLYDIRRDASLAKAAKFNLPSSVVFDSLEDAIARTNANVAFDVTVPEAHEKTVVTAINLGCDVLGEKPLSTSIESASRMIEAATSKAKIYAVMQNRRWLPEMAALRGAIRNGLIGDISELHADMFVGPHFGGFRELMEYPVLRDMAIHTFDQARNLSGADPISVYCHSFNPKHSWYGHHASAVCIFEMTNGIAFSYRGSWCAQGLHADWNGEWRVLGAKGSAKWDGKKSLQIQALKEGGKKAFFYEMEDLPIEIPSLGGSGHLVIIDDFFKCLRERRAPETVCTDNVKSLAMVESAVESAQRGLKIPVRW